MENILLIKPLIDYLKIPSVSTQEEHKNDMYKTRNYLIRVFHSLDFKTKILKGKKHDAVFASLSTNPQLPTILIYGHYDVQPPEPLEEWKTPPFEPTIERDKIYARGAADNKGQHMIHIMAIKKLLTKDKRLTTKDQKLKVNFKFLIEGEEEVGSISIADISKRYKKLLKCDYLIVSDTGMPKLNQPAVNISLRGLLYCEITIRTGEHDLHSGTFGGVAENSATVLARIISKLKNEDGFINIPGFYKDVMAPSQEEIVKIRKNSETPNDIIKEGNLFGVGGGESKYSMDERKWIRPTLDVNGIWSGFQGEGSKTIIPSKACAKISMRLVANQHPDKIYLLFEKYIKKLTPKNAELKIERLSDCLTFQAPYKDNIFKLMELSLKKAFGKYPVYKRVSGSIGAVPILTDALKVPAILVGFSLPGDNLHAPNEWLRLNNYFKGIEAMEYFYSNIDKLNSKDLEYKKS